MRSDNSFLKEYFLFTAYLDHKKVFGLFGIPCGIKRHNHKTTFFKQNFISPTVCMYQCLVSSNGSLVKSRPEALCVNSVHNRPFDRHYTSNVMIHQLGLIRFIGLRKVRMHVNCKRKKIENAFVIFQ